MGGQYPRHSGMRNLLPPDSVRECLDTSSGALRKNANKQSWLNLDFLAQRKVSIHSKDKNGKVYEVWFFSFSLGRREIIATSGDT